MSCIDEKQFQSCNPSEGVAEPCVAVQSANSCFSASKVINEKVDDINDGVIEVGAQILPPQLPNNQLVSRSLNLVQVSDDQNNDGRSDQVLDFSSENIWDHIESDEFLENHVAQEASHNQEGRNVQFEATFNGKYDYAFNCHNSSSLRIALPSLIEPKGIFDSQQALCCGQTMAAQASFLGADSVSFTEKASLQYTDRVKELFQCQDGSKGKRKKETHTDESEGCKLCNCKRSKCLKLYCECFAAGIYCLDTCACENCYNKPDFEDTVLDVREIIQSRNPLAFSPAIVKQANESPQFEIDGNLMIPSPPKHKRGCKCKRSKCLKKYCECYRAKVRCSDGCRCEDCDNSFGKKSESILQRVEKLKNLSHEKLNTVGGISDSIKDGTANQLELTWENMIDVVPSMGSANVENCSNVPQVQSQNGSGFQLSPGYHWWCSSALSNKQECFKKASHEFGSINALCHIMEDYSSDSLMKNSNPTNTVKSGSPNHKHVFSPKLQSYRLDSNSIPDLQSGHKLVLPAIPPFPHLKPHCNSENHMNQIETDRKGSSHDQ